MRAPALVAATALTLSLPTPPPPSPIGVQPQRDARVLMAAVRVSAVQLRQPPPFVLEEPWLSIAACESGDWYGGVPKRGTHRWDYGLAFDHGDHFEGAVNFHPATWDSFRDSDMPGHAGEASPADQIEVAERVLAVQGWGAWPTCSRKMGLR